MKHFFLIIFLILPGIIFSQDSLHTNNGLLIDSIITVTSLRETVTFLSSDSLKGRLTGQKGATEAANFIAAKFYKTGLQPFAGNENYFSYFSTTVNKKKVSGINVVGALSPRVPNDTIVIFSAHYDHIGQGNDIGFNVNYNKKDKIYNGANDNATGVAALIELAKYYTARNDNRYGLLFIAFSGEELGMKGSEDFVKHIDLNLVKAVINFDMLGRSANGKCYIICAPGISFVKELNNRLNMNVHEGGKKFFEEDHYYQEELFYRSDHYPFAEQVKRCFTIMATSPMDEYYHGVNDEINTIDFQFLLHTTKNIALACEFYIY